MNHNSYKGSNENGESKDAQSKQSGEYSTKKW